MDITIFIRTLNEGQYIGPCLQKIFSQNTSLSYEVIILDSESDDDTVKQALLFNVKIFSIPRKLFHYAAALNFGVAKASGEFFVSLSAHAIPLNEKWLAELVKPLKESEEIVASFSRQIAWDDLTELERRKIEKDFGFNPWCRGPKELSALKESSKNIYSFLAFSNVSSCIRTNFLRSSPFRKLPFAEDRALALDCLTAQKVFCYAPLSQVYHAHPPNFQENIKIAERATIARSMIEHQAAGPVAHYPSGSYLLLTKDLFKLPILITYISFRVALNLLTKGSKRERIYWLASLGILLGKIKARLLLIGGTIKLEAESADPAALLNNAKSLKE